ncbi:anhydro-N-acetylmuramic acid kinase [Streptomyces sp. NBC_00519]|uniref:anhydro-N-acetylmuramic acid kinase n=1 Tax=Streptomyces sp. NBC_00519 TaxID=2975764 RepID=UPI0030E046A7
MTLFFGQRRAVRDASTVRALAAGSVGNFVEWYEFGVYGCFATVIAARFFTPEGGGEAEALVRTYASFALAFFFRPVGAALFGRLGDRIGRRPVLILVIVLMTVATTLIGALPAYAGVGALAPWLLTFLRVLQGLSAGGEFGGAVAVVTEFAPPGRRGCTGRGSVHEPLLERLLAEPYYALTAPKTTGKELFHLGYLRDALAGFGTLRAEDVVATLTMLTARTVADAVRALGATEVIASGGGTRNPVLMGMLGERLPGVAVRTSDELGLAADAKEAYAFAVLGFLTWHGLPGTEPASTGARHPSVLGSITPGRGGLRLPAPLAEPPVRLVLG